MVESRCRECGETTVVVNEDGKAKCMTCDLEIENPKVCRECENINDRALDICRFCGDVIDEDEEDEEDVEEECESCGEMAECIDGKCQECTEAFKEFGDDELMMDLLSHFSTLPIYVERICEDEVCVDSITYTIYDEESILSRVEDYIRDCIWTFSPDFLSDMTDVPNDLIRNLNWDLCESLNDCLLELVERTCGLEDFVEEAVRFDGVEHFIEEVIELYVDGETLYLLEK